MGSKPKKPVIFLYGPTAAGKTALAQSLYDYFDTRLISVDAAQVYRGMDIGTAKPDEVELKAYPHALIDIKEPHQNYSAAEFVNDANREIKQCHEQGVVPILVGGTMFYFNALEHGLSDLPDADDAVRAQLKTQEEDIGLIAMHQELSQIDPVYGGKIHPSDRQRVHRALEIYIISGKAPSQLIKNKQGIKAEVDLVKLVVAPPERSQLHLKIEQRFEQMLNRGLINEVESLYNRYKLGEIPPSMRIVGYRQVWEYLEGNANYQEMILKASAATRQLAKRQYTWLRNQSGNTWLMNESTISRVAVQFLKNRIQI